MAWFVIWIVGAVIIFFTPLFLGSKEFTGWEAEDNVAGLFLAAIFWPIILVLVAIILPIVGICAGLSWLYQKGTERMAKFWEKRRLFKESLKKV